MGGLIGQWRCDALDNDGEGARLLDGAGVGNHGFVMRLIAHSLEAAGRVHGLGHQPDMGHDRNAAAREILNGGRHLGAALKLDRVAAGLLDHPAGIAEGNLGAFLERAEGHVDHDEGLVGTANHRLAMHDHVLECDAQRVGHPMDHHAQTVSYQKQVTDLIADMGHMGGVGG